MNQNKLCSLTELLLLVILVLLLSTFFLVFFLAGSKRKSSRLMLDSKRKLNWCCGRQLFSQIFLWLKNLMTIVSCGPEHMMLASPSDYLEDSVENPEEEEGEQDLIFDYEPSKAIERKMIFEAEEERGIDSGRAIRDLSASPGFSISFTFLFTNNISTD
ncbi:hypothetical protein Bca4012_037623 [Brassica carinata]